MLGKLRLRVAVGGSLLLAGVVGLLGGVGSCGTAPTPFIVHGPGTSGNEPPTLTVLEPNASFTRGQGDPFLIRWSDADGDNNAQISFALVNTATNQRILLVDGIDENDSTGPDSFTVDTSFITPGTYNLLGTIADGINAPVESFAMAAEALVTQRVVITIVGAGQGPQTVPPVITVTEPIFNRSVAQDDVLTITIQPTAQPPDANNPYDPDSDVRVFILLDRDLDPNNDDPNNPDPGKIIVLQEQTLVAGEFAARSFDVLIDLATIPPRDDGEPYFIRATADDSTNPPVHSYAVGTINVVRLAAGIVDLFDIGRTKSGAKMQGFNPGAHLGSSLSTVSDFDADGIDDFVLVARFGNPQNVGPVGEAYLIYGQDLIRFGGTIPVNSVADTISGVIFQAPPIRTVAIPSSPNAPEARTDGITHVSFISDLTGDGRPELFFGLPHVHGAYDSTDYDPGDDDLASDPNLSPLGCYPDFFVNNFTDAPPFGEERDVGFYAGGMAVMVNSQNRDNDPRISPVPVRLESTAVSLEFVGQFQVLALDGEGQSRSGFILPRADNMGVDPLGTDPEEPGRIAGARFVAGGFEWVDPFFLRQGPREGLFGTMINGLGDLNSDGLDEIIISSPRNERYLADLRANFVLSTQLISTAFVGSVLVLPGANYNQEFWRDINDDTGTARTPQINDGRGKCTSPTESRRQVIPSEEFEIFAEDIDDWLGGAGSAGDFNQDGLDDILCGAPLNDRSGALRDSGAVYIIYGRTTFGEVQLRNADDKILRAPMLRIRGGSLGDQIGWRQTSGLDVNGDRIDDVFLSSPRTDFGDVTRSCTPADFNGDGFADLDDLKKTDFDRCKQTPETDLFSDDPCKAFDYDNDGDIDDDDECVFCCLSGDCAPAGDCIFGQGVDCCADLVDNGFVGIVFGGEFINGDRTIDQLATSQLPGVIFFGSNAGDRAGFDVSSAGDFNQDGFGDILIAAPGETRIDEAGRERLGVVYLVFGGTHLTNRRWNLRDVGAALPGIVFLSPYVKGRPNEAAPTTLGFIGDINNDGFGDIAIGNPRADFIDPSFPQGPDAPGSDPTVGRRSDVGDVYIVYGNNFGTNRALP